MSWYLAAWKKYAVFTGRARRKDYWFFYLFNMIAAWALMFVDLAMGTTSDSGTGVLYSIYALAALLPALAVGVRRMHDTDHSGWWILVPIVNLVFAITEGTRGPYAWEYLALYAYCCAFHASRCARHAALCCSR